MESKEILLGKRNQVTLPKDFIPDGVTIFLCEMLEDGSIVLHPRVSIPVHQKYYWTTRWQRGEKRASEDIKKGRTRRHASVAALVKNLNLALKK